MLLVDERELFEGNGNRCKHLRKQDKGGVNGPATVIVPAATIDATIQIPSPPLIEDCGW